MLRKHGSLASFLDHNPLLWLKAVEIGSQKGVCLKHNEEITRPQRGLYLSNPCRRAAKIRKSWIFLDAAKMCISMVMGKIMQKFHFRVIF